MKFLHVTDTNFEQLWLLVLITNLSGMLPLPLLGWLPGASEMATEEAEVEAVETTVV
jgi:formate/nitrite transporter FocA (FNT family)